MLTVSETRDRYAAVATDVSCATSTARADSHNKVGTWDQGVRSYIPPAGNRAGEPFSASLHQRHTLPLPLPLRSHLNLPETRSLVPRSVSCASSHSPVVASLKNRAVCHCCQDTLASGPPGFGQRLL